MLFSTMKSIATLRTVTLSRCVLSLVAAILLGAILIPEVEASKPGKNTVKTINERVADQRHNCETIGGGTLSVKDSPFVPNKITTCEGGEYDGTRCTHTPKKTLCGVALIPHEDIVVPPDEAAVLGAPAGGTTSVSAPAGGDVAAQGENKNDREHHRHGGKGRKK